MHLVLSTYYNRRFLLGESIELNNFRMDLHDQYVLEFDGRLDPNYFLDWI